MLSNVSPPAPDRVALADPATRRALAIYGAKLVGTGALGVGLAAVGSLFLDVNGDPKTGVPEFVPFVFLVPALLALGCAVFGLLRLVQMTWTAARRPWALVESRMEVIAMSGTNGQPVWLLTDGNRSWRLTLGALVWRWSRFDQPLLLLAAKPGRGGMVATPGRRSVAWGGRSLATGVLVWRLRRRGEWPPAVDAEAGPHC